MVDLVRSQGLANAAINNMQLVEALQKPPLWDFVLKLRDSEGAPLRFRLHCYGKKSCRIVTDLQRTYTPRLDITRLDEKGNVISIVQVLTARKDRNYLFRLAAIRKQEYSNMDELLACCEDAQTMAKYVLWHYARVAICFHERPEHFIDTGRGGLHCWELHPERARAPHEVPIQTVKAANKTTAANAESERKISCPYWTVSGHYRTLKSGERIWIKPYAKGSKRNDPLYNQPKIYITEEKGGM